MYVYVKSQWMFCPAFPYFSAISFTIMSYFFCWHFCRKVVSQDLESLILMLETLGTWLGDLFRSKIENVLLKWWNSTFWYMTIVIFHLACIETCQVSSQWFSVQHLTDLDLFGPGLCEGLCPKCFGFSHEWRAWNCEEFPTEDLEASVHWETNWLFYSRWRCNACQFQGELLWLLCYLERLFAYLFNQFIILKKLVS
jgi:hypothetical protein